MTYDGIDETVVLCPQDWLAHTAAMVREAFGDRKDLQVIPGGKTRHETLLCAMAYFERKYPDCADAVLITHDAVRPFINRRILEENIRAAREYGACDTAVPATDTIVDSADGRFISAVPQRSRLWFGQTPQSFLMGKLRSVVDALTAEESERLTDACSIFTLKGEPVYIVRGESSNIKITYSSDLPVAEAILRERIES